MDKWSSSQDPVATKSDWGDCRTLLSLPACCLMLILNIFSSKCTVVLTSKQPESMTRLCFPVTPTCNVQLFPLQSAYTLGLILPTSPSSKFRSTLSWWTLLGVCSAVIQPLTLWTSPETLLTGCCLFVPGCFLGNRFKAD